VLRAGVGKAEALAFLQRRWDVAAEETLAVGDNWNDHEMLAEAGLGLVMGNADPELCALGLPLLPSNDDDGVAIAIERHDRDPDAACRDYELWRRPMVRPYEEIGAAGSRIVRGGEKPPEERWPPPA